MTYICCSRCHKELMNPKFAKESMRSYERISVSMSEDKTELLIWCNRHEYTVARIGIEGTLQVIYLGGLGIGS